MTRATGRYYQHIANYAEYIENYTQMIKIIAADVCDGNITPEKAIDEIAVRNEYIRDCQTMIRSILADLKEQAGKDSQSSRGAA